MQIRTEMAAENAGTTPHGNTQKNYNPMYRCTVSRKEKKQILSILKTITHSTEINCFIIITSVIRDGVQMSSQKPEFENI